MSRPWNLQGARTPTFPAEQVRILHAGKLSRARKSWWACEIITFPAARKEKTRPRDFRDASRKFRGPAFHFLAAGKVIILHLRKLFRARKSLRTCKTFFTYPARKVGVRAPWIFYGRDQEIPWSSYTHFSCWISEDFACRQICPCAGKFVGVQSHSFPSS